MSNDILVMDLKGKLMHKIDMTQLLNNEHDYLKKMGRNWNVYDKMNNVLNGIAYHKESQTFFLTGKNWHYLTQVKFNF
jgi:glutamine cyclotransferase